LGSIPQATYKAAVDKVFLDNSLGLYEAVLRANQLHIEMFHIALEA